MYQLELYGCSECLDPSVSLGVWAWFSREERLEVYCSGFQASTFRHAKTPHLDFDPLMIAHGFSMEDSFLYQLSATLTMSLSSRERFHTVSYDCGGQNLLGLRSAQ